MNKRTLINDKSEKKDLKEDSLKGKRLEFGNSEKGIPRKGQILKDKCIIVKSEKDTSEK